MLFLIDRNQKEESVEIHSPVFRKQKLEAFSTRLSSHHCIDRITSMAHQSGRASTQRKGDQTVP